LGVKDVQQRFSDLVDIVSSQLDTSAQEVLKALADITTTKNVHPNELGKLSIGREPVRPMSVEFLSKLVNRLIPTIRQARQWCITGAKFVYQYQSGVAPGTLMLS
jgi:hypothetical protein